jgi:hypothetical protein
MPIGLQNIKQYKSIFLKEFILYCQKHKTIPRMSEIDAKEGSILDAEQVAWRVLYLRM